MSAAPVCILYTQDPDLVRRVKAYLRTMASVRHVTDPNRLEAVLQQTSPAVVLMDLRAKDCRDLLDLLEREWVESLVVALGAPRSEPLREAEQSAIYAAEDLQLDRHRFQTLLGRAFDHLRLMQQNRDLREQSYYGPFTEPARRVTPMMEGLPTA
jgi:DNA-binding NtrC family response regulator